jgi:IS30 family transposase
MKHGTHETIYRDVYTPSRKVFDASMFHHLRTDRPIRRPRRKSAQVGFSWPRSDPEHDLDPPPPGPGRHP